MDDGLESLFSKTACEDATGYTATRYQLFCLGELNKARDLADFSVITHKLVRKIGLTDFTVGRMHSPNPEAAMLLKTTPTELSDYYKHKDVWRNDLMLQIATSKNSPKIVYQSDVDDYVNSSKYVTEMIECNRETRAWVRSRGFLDYINIPVRAANGNGNVLVALTAKGVEPSSFRKFIEPRSELCSILANTLDFVGTKKFADSFLGRCEPQEIVLQRRPLQLLTLMAIEDLQLQEAAERLHISISAANQQAKAARDALGARTNHGAMITAIKKGLIDLIC